MERFEGKIESGSGGGGADAPVSVELSRRAAAAGAFGSGRRSEAMEYAGSVVMGSARPGIGLLQMIRCTLVKGSGDTVTVAV